jgi:hypothetical protein
MYNQQSVSIKKSDDKKRIVWAEVYAPDRPDADGEFMRADQIEEMAYEYMKTMKLDAVDHQHSQNEEDATGCVVVESFIARKGDPDFIEGAWVVGMYIGNDDMWDKVEKGEINGFSMEAMVIKETKEVELDIPSVLSGKTFKDDDTDHTHDFLVAYNIDETSDRYGKFMGGRTSVHTDGHFHVIKSGTVTETAAGHRHRFSHVEGLKIR